MISIVYPYFNQPEVLLHHEQQWAKFKGVDVVVVDDCSREKPLKPSVVYRSYRVKDDLGWNITGAKNIGMHEAIGEWCFVGDLDHMVCENMIEFVKSAQPKNFYIFRRRLEDGTLGEFHMNFLLIRKNDFWSVGGYDEDFAGGYGYEDIWFSHVATHSGLNRVLVHEAHTQALGNISDASMPAHLRDRQRNLNLYYCKRRAWGRKLKLFAENSNHLRCAYSGV